MTFYGPMAKRKKKRRNMKKREINRLFQYKNQ